MMLIVNEDQILGLGHNRTDGSSSGSRLHSNSSIDLVASQAKNLLLIHNEPHLMCMIYGFIGQRETENSNDRSEDTR
jgi:hypothetical protein